MSDIQMAQLRRLDMTQLLVFSALLRHKKLTIVAEEIGLTQSAISHILKRLRDTFQDELFLRLPNGVTPTHRALALAPLVNQIIALSASALQIDKDFDPMSETRIVRISGPDLQMAVFAPQIIDLFSEEAPGLRLSFTNQARNEALERLTAGHSDIAIGFFWDLPDQFEGLPLYEESYRVIMRQGHALEHQELDMDRFCAAEHLLVSARGELEGIVDMTLSASGRIRNVKASVGSFFPALTTVATSDLISTIPTRLALRYCAQFNLIVRDVPLSIRPFGVSAVWHKRTTTDPALKWARTKISSLVV